MSLTSDEITELLQLSQLWDKRTIGRGDVIAWSDTATLGRWTFSEAAAAIRAHHAEEPDKWLAPGHITKRIKEARQDAAMREPIVQPDPLGQARLAELTAVAFQSIGDDEQDRTQRRETMRRRCPFCGAAPWSQCVRPSKTGPTPTALHPSRRSAVDDREVAR